MAVITISNTGGNWNNSATWVGGVIPGAADDVIATATSGPLTVNVASSCKSIVFTNYVSTLTVNNLLDVFGTFTLVPAMTVAGISQVRFNTTATLTSAGISIPWALLFSGTSQTYTLGDNWTVTGNISCTSTTALTINSNQILANASFNVNTAGCGGTTTIVMSGTGSISTTGTLRNNLTINTTGTTTFSGTIYYNTGILTYITGTVVTTGSTIIFQNANTTLNTNGIIWNIVTFQGTGTYTLTSNMTCTNLNLGSGATTVIDGSTIFVSGNLTVITSVVVSGTTTIEMNGTGSYTHTSTGALRNSLIFNTAGTITISGTVYYNTGTMTYISGTIVTTGSTLAIGASTTLNTNPISWINFSLSGAANVTMSSDINITGTLSITNGGSFTSVSGSQLVTSGNFAPAHTLTSPLTSTITLPNIINIVNVSGSVTGNLYAALFLNGPGINVSGNVSIATSDPTMGLKGSAPLNLVGTGTLSSTTITGGAIYCPININTTGTITLGTYFTTGSPITYTQGTFINAGSSIWIRTGGGFDLIGFDSIFWDCPIRTGWDSGTPIYTLSSNLNCRSFTAGGVSTANGTGTINCNSLTINNSVSGGSNISNSFNINVNVYGNATFGPGGSSFVIGTAADKSINVYGDLSLSAPTTIYGNATIKMLGTGTISSPANFRQFDLIIDTPGNITISNTLYWNTTATAIAAKTITYLTGNVSVAKTAGLYIGNLNATFTNMHRIPWPTVTITSGQTITLNEFFSGTANYKTVVVPTSTTNYNISFTDGFERLAKFVEISNCTLTRPNQLIVAGDCRAKGTNRGIRYTNQSPNGLPKNLGKTKPSMTFDTSGLIPDPNFVKLK